jgi:hypothetical protein
MQRILFILLVVFPGVLLAQQKQIPVYPLKDKGAIPPPIFRVSATPNKLPQNTYYEQCFGYFCKREWNWEKQTKVPIKLRLGTYQTAQRMEGKQ